ncbi:leucine Rich repeat-containing domain protein [Necator americanus]|uniref:Leucine Rich repeat-containing domain protein n=1 Tax=Necator americanus TaxID=51031 RepID=W2SJ12_NECAM|nr:leucine Rich repeat-containing domain protein [Necator americanus]ETN69558.1 leucine Rich repeat-containing domain protein [Necator americanus]
MNLCKCEDLHNGVSLDCSHSNGAEAVQLLRDNQALLGLIQSLTMHYANLRSIPPRFLAGLYIKRLDLSYNQMVEVHPEAFSGMSPVVQELILTHNNLTKIPVNAMATLSTILRVDLSNNSIANISDSDTIPSLPKLYDINLGTNKICSIHSAAFRNVRDSIQIINLGHNCLNSVPSSSIRGLKQLQALHMQKNNITALEALNFLNLPVLNLLNLAGNKISDVNRQAFLNVPQLKYLYLTNNRISKLTPHQFVSFDQIEMIDLTGNEITDIPSECMSQLPQLRQLFLGGNRIKTIGRNAFANSSIVILSLVNNQLKEITEGMLDGMPNLQSVVFKNNKISSIHHNAFYDAPSMVMIDLSDNELFDLLPSTFLAQLNLQMIDLRNNKIIRTPYAAFNRRIGTVFLQENPLVCTEKIHMLQDGVAVFIATSEDLICGGKTTTTSTTAAPFMEPVPIRPISSNESPTQFKPKEIHRSGGLHQSDISRITLPKELDHDFKEKLGSTEIEELATTEKNKSDLKQATTEKNTSVEATTLGRRVYTDIADNPNLIHPFPVPFLKKPVTVHKAARVNPSTQTNAPSTEVHTLPPSIVIAARRPSSTETEQNVVDDGERFEQFALRSHTTVQSKQDVSEAPLPTSTRLASPTFIIVVCLTVVAVVMVSVVVGLCTVRYRQIGRFTSTYSESSAARTNAYVSAQAAQMNVIYGTMERDR